MDKIVITVLCSVALAVALGIVVRWGGMDASVRTQVGSPIAQALRRLCVLEVSGIVAGLLVGGFGSRLMMRIMAATSSAAAQGRITQADEVVGKVTQEGTVGLLLFVGIGFGVIGAGVYAVAGRFLPRRAWLAGVGLGLLVLGVFARRDPLDPRNRDFTILSPVVLAVVLIIALFVIYGATVVSLAARLDRGYPHIEAWNGSLVAFLPLLLLMIPPLPIALIVAVGLGALQERVPSLGGAWRSRLAGTIGAAAIALLTIAGNVWLAFGVADILQA